MKVITEVSALQEISEYYRRTGKEIGFVPTMGYLHEGHIALLKKARAENDIVICSIYVNPTQFLKGEDFEQYPRDFEKDYFACQNAGADYIFYPDNAEMYKRNHYTNVMVSNITGKLEGAMRPGHFIGVATIVLKLINISKPHRMYLGQKDAQQVVVLKKMAVDLNVDVDIRTVETIREYNGLAKSSRNVYLSDEEKEEAAVLNYALREGQRVIAEDILNNTEDIKEFLNKIISSKAPGADIQYIAITDNEELDEISNLAGYKGEVLISLAVRFNRTRLIDNVLFVKT
jgi:pantoate--beta-alanine ligase